MFHLECVRSFHHSGLTYRRVHIALVGFDIYQLGLEVLIQGSKWTILSTNHFPVSYNTYFRVFLLDVRVNADDFRAYGPWSVGLWSRWEHILLLSLYEPFN